MQISLGTDFALRILITLSANAGGEKGGQLSVDWIASHYGISRNHLAKVAHKLQKEGLITGTRGRSGGIRLGRSAEDINVGDVVRLFERLDSYTICGSICGCCPIAQSCALIPAMEQAMAAFIGVFDRYSLADITQNKADIWQNLLSNNRSLGLTTSS